MHINKYLTTFMDAFPFEALTFDDVSLVTQYSDFLPHETGIRSRLTRNIEVNVPFVSAAMDTVTEAPMAIAMAMLGGIGIIHKNLTPEVQANMVQKVKHHLNGLIAHPVTFHQEESIRKVQEARRERSYSFSGFPILDDHGRLVGILTARDIKFSRSTDLKIKDVMTREVITSPVDTTLEDAYDIMRKHRIGKLPLVQDGKLEGLYSYADVSNLIEKANPMYNRDDNYCLRVGAAVGPYDYRRVELLDEKNVDVLVIDTAHGHSKGVIDMTAWVKKNYAHIEVISGNIASTEAALALRDAGADAIKVGIGPGSICTTRVVTGVGVPQITAIYACTAALDGTLPVIADGGIAHSGDVPKALVAGAETVMMGSVLAGTNESPGEKIIYEGRQYVVYRGMGSLDAMKSSAASRERYQQQDGQVDDLVPQGIEGVVPFAGSVEKVIKQFVGGLRSSMGFCGCRTIQDLRERGRFIRVSSAGVREAHPHDIKITKEAPNYRR